MVGLVRLFYLNYLMPPQFMITMQGFVSTYALVAIKENKKKKQVPKEG